MFVERSGDYLRVGGVELGPTNIASGLEYERAKVLHPENPAFHMRGMFFTGSPHGQEILDLFETLLPQGDSNDG